MMYLRPAWTTGDPLPARCTPAPRPLGRADRRTLPMAWVWPFLVLLVSLLGAAPVMATPAVTITADPSSVVEGGAPALFRVQVNDPDFPYFATDLAPVVEVAVDFGGTATLGVEYQATGAPDNRVQVPMTILGGDRISGPASGEATISIQALADARIDPDQTIVLSSTVCRHDTGNQLVTTPCAASATMLILDRTPLATIEATIPTASKETLEAGELRISLSNPAPEGGIRIPYGLSGSATAGVDYAPLPGSLDIPAGQTSATLRVTPLPGEPDGVDSVLTVTLQPGAGYQIGTSASASVAIVGRARALISVISGNDQLATSRQPLQPFVVRVATASGPIVGATVNWTLEQGDGGLSRTVSTTDSNGETSTVLTPGVQTQPRVRATLAATGDWIEFSAIASSPLTDLPGLTPGQRSVAGALDALCPNLSLIASQRALTAGEQDLLSQCRTLIAASGANPGGVAQGIAALTPEQASAPRKLITQISSVQVDNLTDRLGALRRGARGISLSGLRIGFGEQSVSGALLSKALTPSLDSGGAASADEDWPFERLGLFITGDLQWGSKDRTINEDGFDFDTLGLTAGADYRFADGLVLGTALGYASTTADISANGGELDAQSWSLSLYGTYYPTDHLYLEGSVTYGWDSYDQDRTIDYSLLGEQRTAQASFNGNQYTLLLGAGYDLLSGATIVDLYGRLRYTNASLEDYREHGASGLDLVIADQDAISFKTILGTQVSRSFSTRRAVLIPQGWIEWEHELERGDDQVAGHFLHDPNQFGFSLPTDRLEEDLIRLGLGLGAQFGEGRTAFISYQTALGMQDYSEHSVTAGIRIEF